MSTLQKGETKKPALRRPGRPPKGNQNMKLYRVYLSEEQHQKALVAGDGVYAEGIRIMIDAYAPHKKAHKPAKN